jgi:hypothetical protein
MMTTNHRMEGLSRAYLQAVAAMAGVNLQYQLTDYGVDYSLREVKQIEGRYVDTGIMIDVQLRSTTRARIRESDVAFDLDVDTYNFLRERTDLVPRILLLLVLPEQEAQWLRTTEKALMLRNCMYWASLRGKPATKSRSSVRISISRANRFQVAALVTLLDRCRRGEL